MSAPDYLRPQYTDSIKLRSGLDCTDYNGLASTVNNQHGNKDSMSRQPPSATAAASADVIPTSTNSTVTAGASSQSDLNREDARLVTFENDNWDVQFLNKRKLAQIGFYYIGPQDTVKCYFCKVEIGKWEQDDDCFTEHSRWSPSCPLLRRQQTDNVPIDAEQLNQVLPPITYDTCGINGGGVMIRPNAYAERSFTPAADNELTNTNTTSSSPSSMRSSPTSLEEMSTSRRSSPFRFTEGGGPVSAPMMMPAEPQSNGAPMLATMNQLYTGSTMGGSPTYFNPLTTPHLEIEANRLRTFKEWPIQLKMKPIELSDAGFFYTGMGDRVQCHSCGGGLKNWEDDDVAWEQHALWYPNCDYMKLIKGQKYIEEVQAIHRRKQQQENGSSQGEDEAVENSEDESLESLSEGAEAAPRRQRDAMPSTSRAASSATAQKIARRRLSKMGSGSHPESDPCSPAAMLAARSGKASEVPETKLCKICYECEFNTAFIPCGHVVACAKCASAVTTCPMCREPFDSVTRIYFS